MCCIELLFVVDVSDPQQGPEDGQLWNDFCEDLVLLQVIGIFERDCKELSSECTLVDDVLGFVKEFELVALKRGCCKPLDFDILGNCGADRIMHLLV